MNQAPEHELFLRFDLSQNLICFLPMSGTDCFVYFFRREPFLHHYFLRKLSALCFGGNMHQFYF